MARGKDVAAIVEKEGLEDLVKHGSLSAFGPALQKIGDKVMRCQVRKDKSMNLAIRHTDPPKPFDAVVDKKAGIFIVQLGEDGDNEHAVVVCCKDRLVLDSADHHCLLFNSSVLKRCGGRRSGRLCL